MRQKTMSILAVTNIYLFAIYQYLIDNEYILMINTRYTYTQSRS